jgi:hypothetical protein
LGVPTLGTPQELGRTACFRTIGRYQPVCVLSFVPSVRGGGGVCLRAPDSGPGCAVHDAARKQHFGFNLSLFLSLFGVRPCGGVHTPWFECTYCWSSLARVCLFRTSFLPSTGVDRTATRRHTAWWMRAPPPSSRPQRPAPVRALGWALAASQVQPLGETGCCTACPESQDLSGTKCPPWIEPWPLSRYRVAVPFRLVAWGMGHVWHFCCLIPGLHPALTEV